MSTLPSSGARPGWRTNVCRGERPRAPRRKQIDKTRRGASTAPARRARSTWASSRGPGLPSCPSPPGTRCSHACGCVHIACVRTHSSAVLQLLQGATALTVTDDDVGDPTQSPVALWVRTGAVRWGPAGRRGSAWDPSLRPEASAGGAHVRKRAHVSLSLAAASGDLEEAPKPWGSPFLPVSGYHRDEQPRHRALSEGPGLAGKGEPRATEPAETISKLPGGAAPGGKAELGQPWPPAVARAPGPQEEALLHPLPSKQMGGSY